MIAFQTRRLKGCDIAPGDTRSLVRLFEGAAKIPGVRIPHITTVSGTTLVQRLIKETAPPRRHITMRDGTGTFIGYGNIEQLDFFTAQIGVAIDPLYRGHRRGVGTEAIQGLTAYCFDHIGSLFSVKALTSPSNIACLTALERSGYQHQTGLTPEGLCVMEIRHADWWLISKVEGRTLTPQTRLPVPAAA